MPFGVRVKKGYCCLSFEVCVVEGKVPGRARLEGKEGGDLPAYRYDVVVPGEVKIAETGRRMAFRYVGREEVFQSTGNTAFMDCAGISFPLTVRSWLHGDRIEPLGMEGSKKVHDIFVDCKVPREDRKVVSLLTDRASVIWVAGLRLSRRVAITERTTGVLKVEFY
jgi:tRNA(Ile)-lysidine synthetase-like protein